MPDEAIGEAQAIEALAQRSRLLEMIREAEAALADADRAVADARAGIEAAQAADEVSMVDVRAARDVLDQALDRQEEAVARLRGLQRRLVALDETLPDAARAVMGDLQAFMAAQTDRIAAEYAKHAEALTNLLSEAKMLGGAVANIAVDGQGAGFYLGLGGIALTRDLRAHPDAHIEGVGINKVRMDHGAILWDQDGAPTLTDVVRRAADLAELIRQIQRRIEASEREARQQATAGD